MFEGFVVCGLSEVKVCWFIEMFVSIVVVVCDEFWVFEENCLNWLKLIIVVFVGFYGVYFVDGFEYWGYYGIIEDEFVEFYCFCMKVLIEVGVDVLVCEMILCLIEVKVIVWLLKEFFEMYVWISFSVKDGLYISDGIFVVDCVLWFDEYY